MVKGLNSLNQKMRVTIPRRTKQLARSALAVWAGQVQASMEAFVPQRSGALFESIGWVWGNTPPKGSIAIGTVGGSDPELTITIFAGNDEAFWARWIEFGTQPHPIGDGSHPGTTAQPFFFPAVRLNKKRGQARVARAIRKGILEGSR